jgi:site-specific recombinase XerC
MLTFARLIEGWKGEQKPEKRTVYDFKRAINRLTEHVGFDDPLRVTKTDVANWKASLLREGKDGKTVFNHIAPIHAIYKWAVRNEMVPINPASGLNIKPKDKPSDRRRLPFTDDAAKLILSAARGEVGARRWFRGSWHSPVPD